MVSNAKKKITGSQERMSETEYRTESGEMWIAD